MAFNEVRRWHTMLWRLSAGLTWCRSCCKLDWGNKLQQTSKKQSTRTHPDTICCWTCCPSVRYFMLLPNTLHHLANQTAWNCLLKSCFLKLECQRGIWRSCSCFYLRPQCTNHVKSTSRIWEAKLFIPLRMLCHSTLLIPQVRLTLDNPTKP